MMTRGLSKDCRVGLQLTPGSVLFPCHSVYSVCLYYVGGVTDMKTTVYGSNSNSSF